MVVNNFWNNNHQNFRNADLWVKLTSSQTHLISCDSTTYLPILTEEERACSGRAAKHWTLDIGPMSQACFKSHRFFTNVTFLLMFGSLLRVKSQIIFKGKLTIVLIHCPWGTTPVMVSCFRSGWMLDAAKHCSVLSLEWYTVFSLLSLTISIQLPTP